MLDNFKRIEKLERRIAVILQKLEHVNGEIFNLEKKSKKKPLRKKQSWHLKKLYKVKNYYCEEINKISNEIVQIRCEIDGGYSSETNPIKKNIID